MDVSPLAGILAERLLRYTPFLEKVFFTNSGAEAVEASMKFARKATGRLGFVYCANAFHGLSYGALSLNGDDNFCDGFGPLLRTDFQSGSPSGSASPRPRRPSTRSHTPRPTASVRTSRGIPHSRSSLAPNSPKARQCQYHSVAIQNRSVSMRCRQSSGGCCHELCATRSILAVYRRIAQLAGSGASSSPWW